MPGDALFTVMLADAEAFWLLLALAVAVLAYVPAPVVPVALVTCTLAVALLARSPKLQLRVCGPVPVIAQVPGPGYAGLIVQLTPLPPGSGSLSVTPLALPGPPLLTVTVKPSAS